MRRCRALQDPNVAFVQTPQYYANHGTHRMAAAAWSQQALFFGIIAQGKAGLRSMFCCGTNVLFRRAALEDVGGFPEESLTEDFLLSVRMQERGWETAYVPRVLAQGLGPEDAASYVGQQRRWAKGCIAAIPAVLRAKLPWRQRLQYLLSASYFLSGWTILVYLSLPMIRILTGQQPLAQATAAQFLGHFLPYYTVCIVTVAVAGAGTYTFAGVLRLGEQFLDPRRRHHGRPAAPPRRFRGDPEARFRRAPAGGGRPPPSTRPGCWPWSPPAA